MTTLERFTYDWLIRFMELATIDSIPILTTVSPLFTQCANKYAPIFIDPETSCYAKEPYTLPSEVKKNVVHFGYASVSTCKKMVEHMHPRFYFYLKTVGFNGVKNLEFSNLKRLLSKSIKNEVRIIDCKFTTQVLFSKVWPLMSNCKAISLDIENLCYDANMASVLPNCEPCHRLRWLQLHRVPASEDVVCPIVDHYLTTKRKRCFLFLSFSQVASTSVLKSMAEVIEQKIKQAGFTIFTNSSNDMLFGFRREGSFDEYFSD